MQAPWLNLTDPNLSPEELQKRQLLIGNMNDNSLQYIHDFTNFEDFGKAQAAGGAVASIMEAASASPEAALTVGLHAKGLMTNIVEVRCLCRNGAQTSKYFTRVVVHLYLLTLILSCWLKLLNFYIISYSLRWVKEIGFVLFRWDACTAMAPKPANTSLK